MLVGGAGCGKTVLVNDLLQSSKETSMITTIPFNHYTTSLMLQGVMEKPLEKKAGKFNNLAAINECGFIENLLEPKEGNRYTPMK